MEALRSLGADIEYIADEGACADKDQGRRLEGGTVELPDGLSSQFASALLLASPFWNRPLILSEKSLPSVSRPYFEMTREVMRRFRVRRSVLYDRIRLVGRRPFYQLVLMRPGTVVRLSGLSLRKYRCRETLRWRRCSPALGVTTLFREDAAGAYVLIEADPDEVARLAASDCPVRLDMRDTPDLVPSFVTALCFAGIRFELSGISHLRLKESDRMAILALELSKAGFRLAAEEDSIAWRGRGVSPGRNRRNSIRMLTTA